MRKWRLKDSIDKYIFSSRGISLNIYRCRSISTFQLSRMVTAGLEPLLSRFLGTRENGGKSGTKSASQWRISLKKLIKGN